MLADVDHGGESVVIGFERAHHFEQLHLVYRIEEVHADALLSAVSHTGNLRDAERRRIRSQNRRGTADLVEQGEDFNLRFHLLGNRFNHQIGFARCFLHRSRVFQTAESRSGVGHGNFF